MKDRSGPPIVFRQGSTVKRSFSAPCSIGRLKTRRAEEKAVFRKGDRQRRYDLGSPIFRRSRPADHRYVQPGDRWWDLAGVSMKIIATRPFDHGRLPLQS